MLFLMIPHHNMSINSITTSSPYQWALKTYTVEPRFSVPAFSVILDIKKDLDGPNFFLLHFMLFGALI